VRAIDVIAGLIIALLARVAAGFDRLGRMTASRDDPRVVVTGVPGSPDATRAPAWPSGPEGAPRPQPTCVGRHTE